MTNNPHGGPLPPEVLAHIPPEYHREAQVIASRYAHNPQALDQIVLMYTDKRHVADPDAERARVVPPPPPPPTQQRYREQETETLEEIIEELAEDAGPTPEEIAAQMIAESGLDEFDAGELIGECRERVCMRGAADVAPLPQKMPQLPKQADEADKVPPLPKVGPLP